MKLKLSYLFIAIFIFLIFQNYDLVLFSSLDAVKIWLTKVFPFLFIMFIINDILINLNFDQFFKSSIPFILIMSLLSGAPSSAYIISSLVKQGKITKKNANYFLLFTYFANPLFMYTILNSLFNQTIALKLIIIHYLSNLIILLLNCKKINNQKINNQKEISFNLGKTITKSMNTLTMILGTITFFMILTNILAHTLNLNLFFTVLFKGILEVTQGLNNLNSLNIAIKLKEIIAIAFISFGGLSIHSQVKCLLDEVHLNYYDFLKGRLYQALISIFLTALT